MFPSYEATKLDAGFLIKRDGDESAVCYLAVPHDDATYFLKAENKVLSFMHVYSMLSGFSPTIASMGGQSIRSAEELGISPGIKIGGRLTVRYTPEQIKENLNLVRKSWDKSASLTPKINRLLQSKQNQYLRLAMFQQYESGKFDTPADNRFVTACIGLEALFNDGPQDISYKLAARTTLLLSTASTKLACTMSEIKKLYTKRNNIVHGIGQEVAEYQDCERLRLILRETLKPLLALSLNNSKDQSMTKIDEALVTPDGKAKLKEEIALGLSSLGL